MASKEVNNGGWAFPQANGGGMSMLEWYAGQALAGELAAYTPKTDSNYSPAMTAIRCFNMAEAMIAEYERRTAEPKTEIPKQDIKSTVITCRNCNRRKVVDVPELCNECL